MVLYGPTIEHRNNSYNMKLSTFYYLMLDVTYRQYILLNTQQQLIVSMVHVSIVSSRIRELLNLRLNNSPFCFRAQEVSVWSINK